jgi:hypothetical protein
MTDADFKAMEISWLPRLPDRKSPPGTDLTKSVRCDDSGLAMRQTAILNYLNGRSTIEAPLDELSTPDWIFDVTLDANNHVQSLFFAHKKQVELFHANPDILIMDCTSIPPRLYQHILEPLPTNPRGRSRKMLQHCEIYHNLSVLYHLLQPPSLRSQIPLQSSL